MVVTSCAHQSLSLSLSHLCADGRCVIRDWDGNSGGRMEFIAAGAENQPLARGPVIDRATRQIVSLTRSRRLLSMADTAFHSKSFLLSLP